MTYFKLGRRRATTATLLASVLAALTLVPLSQAATEGGGGTAPSNTVDRFAELGWDGLYASGLRASSEYLRATSLKNPAGAWEDVFRVTVSSTVWDRATDGDTAKVRIEVRDKDDETLYTSQTYQDYDGRQDKFSFTTYQLARKPASVVRRVWADNAGPSTTERVNFYTPY